MTSLIDPTKPATTAATTASVRANFTAAKNEIEALQAVDALKADLASPTFTGTVTAPLIALTGGQIAFPAVAVPSANVNTLDDYEEGTWTPALTFGGASVGITYNAATGGTYTKIGRLVTADFLLFLSNKGSSVGAALITGLPFAPASTSNYIVAIYWSLSTTKVTVIGQANGAASNIILYGAAAATATPSTLADTDFANTSFLRGTLIYSV